MFKKYLIKNDFWMTRSNRDLIFVKHTPECGGIYARLLKQEKGVEIQYNNERNIFTNFVELDNYLDRINVSAPSNDSQSFFSLLNRKMTSKVLRSLPL